MRRIILSGIAFGLAVGLMHHLLAGIIAAVITYALVNPNNTPSKIVMTHDFNTGETKTQPMDRATERYLRDRERKDGK
jgi:hypothetical protein